MPTVASDWQDMMQNHNPQQKVQDHRLFTEPQPKFHGTTN